MQRFAYPFIFTHCGRQQFLHFLPLPHGHGSFLPGFLIALRGVLDTLSSPSAPDAPVSRATCSRFGSSPCTRTRAVYIMRTVSSRMSVNHLIVHIRAFALVFHNRIALTHMHAGGHRFAALSSRRCVPSTCSSTLRSRMTRSSSRMIFGVTSSSFA